MYLKDIAQLVELHFDSHVASAPDQDPGTLHADILPLILGDLSARRDKFAPSAATRGPGVETEGEEDLIKVQTELASKLLENLIQSRTGHVND
ncbi:hypothetical protein [Roseibium sp.]|uniref:hypothetical protein n=1 Tax=Roseibium sp. TaxID=1936156 RepID=UPI003A97D861